MILPAYEASGLLRAAGIPVVQTARVASAEEAVLLADSLSYPVALKLSSARFPHKTEIGGIALDLKGRDPLITEFQRLDGLRKALDPSASIILEPMISGGVEFFVGAQRHPQFGALASLGFGGVWLELFEDVAFRLLPATRGDFREMVEELKCWSKLERGFRNLPPVNGGALVDLLESASAFFSGRDDLVEMDFNPVVMKPDGAMVLDARLVARGDA